MWLVYIMEVLTFFDVFLVVYIDVECYSSLHNYVIRIVCESMWFITYVLLGSDK